MAKLEGTTLHFHKQGTGDKTLCVFHGFGQDHGVFHSYTDELSDKYTIYSFDIYYHGRSIRPETILTKEQWQSDFKLFLVNEKIERFSLLGFSLGGRFILSLLETFHERIDGLILLAPDGIYKSRWFSLATSNIGNWVFKRIILHEKLFNRFLNSLEDTRLASHSIVRFARKELPTQRKRQQVYRTWTYFCTLQYTTKETREMLAQFKGSVAIFLGVKDIIVPIRKIQRPLSGIETIQFHVIDAKHNQMIENAKTHVSTLLNRG